MDQNPAEAIVAGGVGELDLGALGYPPADADALPPGPSAPRITTPLRPPFFQATTFNYTGATSSDGGGVNNTSCNCRSTSPEGVRLPFMIWESMAELMPPAGQSRSG